MSILALIFGLLLFLATLIDGFETILLPRRIYHRFRYSRLYVRTTWVFWRLIADASPRRWREPILSAFGPLAVVGLFTSWVVSFVLSFALLHWSLHSQMGGQSQSAVPASFGTNLYFSGTTFVTLGLGDVTPHGPIARALAAGEGGLGFAFLAVIISYLPVLYQSFSRREAIISLMDARAGSPPSGGEFLLRLARVNGLGEVNQILREWERWCAELLESHISFPVLAYYRSQHANQSWLSALATTLDSCALLLTTIPAADSYQAQLTFAMARHAAVDIALIFSVKPHMPHQDRLAPADRARFHEFLRSAKVSIDESGDSDARLAELRGSYEPFLVALADHFIIALPPIFVPDRTADNWQRSAWVPRPVGIGQLPTPQEEGDHFL